MPKYLYMYNESGIDKLNPNVIDNTERQAEQLAQITNPNDDEDTFGVAIVLTDFGQFIDAIQNIPTEITVAGQSFPLASGVYIGYYYDQPSDQYVIDNQAIAITPETAYDQLASHLIALKKLDPQEITNTMVDGQIKDTENVLKNHECDVINLDRTELAQFKQRLTEITN